MTVSAPARFSPWPPARVLRRNINVSSSSEKSPLHGQSRPASHMSSLREGDGKSFAIYRQTKDSGI